MNSIQDIWEEILRSLSSRLTPTAINTWFADSVPVSLEDYRLVIRTPSEFKKKIISDRFSASIKAVLSDLFSCDFELLILVGDEEYEPDEKDDPDDFPEMAGYTFDNFIVGNSNKFAHAAAIAVAENPGKNYNPLFIYGNSGLGKTHLLWAIGHSIREHFPEKKISYIKGDDFTNELIKAIKEGKTEDFRNKHRHADLLLFDDGNSLKAVDILPYLTTQREADTNRRAYDWLCDWIASNPNRFTPDNLGQYAGECWGKVEEDGGKAYIIKSVFDRVMTDAGFSPASFLSWAKKAGRRPNGQRIP